MFAVEAVIYDGIAFVREIGIGIFFNELGPKLVRVPSATGIQAGLVWRAGYRRSAAEHQPHMPAV
jgi:hypothetical protein